MGVIELLSKLDALGVVLRPEGDRILYRPRDAVSTDLVDQLRLHKERLLEFLSWPAEAAGHPSSEASRLLPVLGKTVLTPAGSGQLVVVLPELVRVKLLQDSQGIVSFLPYEVEPLEVRTQDGSYQPRTEASPH